MFSFNYGYTNNDNKLDSLKIELSKAKHDTTKSNLLERIGHIHTSNTNYHKAIEAYLKAKKIFIKIGDKTNESEMLNIIGAQYYYLKNWDKAIDYWSKALTLAKELDNISDQARYLNKIGLIYEKRGIYDNALKCHTNSLIIRQ